MEKKNSCAGAGFLSILWGVLAVLLCAAPCVRAVDITEPMDGPYYAEGEVNVYADITYGLFANSGSTVNIYAGAIGDGLYYGITVSPDEPNAVVTVYGTDFDVTNGTIDPSGSYFTIINIYLEAVLTGTYGGGGDINLVFMSDIPIFLAAPAKEVAIDIKPGSDTNAINLGSNGVIPVAILSDADFDATTVDPESVSLAGSGVAVRGKGNKLLAHEEDVNGDGLMDLVVKVETENLDPGTFQDGLATLTIHETSDPESAILFQGSDQISIVPPEG